MGERSLHLRAEGGESGLAVTARALPVLLELVQAHPGETILVVSHKATIRLLVSSILGFDPRRYRDNLDLKPASLTILDFKGPANSRLSLYNDTSHYMRGRQCPAGRAAGALVQILERGSARNAGRLQIAAMR